MSIEPLNKKIPKSEESKNEESSFILKFKLTIKKYVCRTIYTIYRKLEKYPKIRGILQTLNNKFFIIKDKKAFIKHVVLSMEDILEEKNLYTKPHINQIRVTMLVDEFTYNSFKYEFIALPIEPSNWISIFQEQKPHIFFCESAWSGIDSEKRHWKGQVYHSTNFRFENRKTLLEILAYCKSNKIPTIFWNKEDPTHFNDKIHNFVKTAILFDHIFTTSEECVDLYKNIYKHKSVYCLKFATQPKIFNPIERFIRTDDIIFAGSWYKQHEQRCSEMCEIFDLIISKGYKLKIYDRYYNSLDPNHDYPSQYLKYVNSMIPFSEIEKVYKESKFALNINTVTDSKTMFARRVFELMSCNTLVITNESIGINEIFEDNVIYTSDLNIDFDKVNEKCEVNLYNVLLNHTYYNRFKQILDSINFMYEDINRGISFVYNISHIKDIDNALFHYYQISYMHKNCILFIKKEYEKCCIKDLFEKYNNNNIYIVSEDYIINYDYNFDMSTDYFMFVDINKFNVDFPGRAILHFQYIDGHIGIKEVDDDVENKYTFKYTDSVKNILFKSTLFKIYSKSSCIDKLQIYNI